MKPNGAHSRRLTCNVHNQCALIKTPGGDSRLLVRSAIGTYTIHTADILFMEAICTCQKQADLWFEKENVALTIGLAYRHAVLR